MGGDAESPILPELHNDLDPPRGQDQSALPCELRLDHNPTWWSCGPCGHAILRIPHHRERDLADQAVSQWENTEPIVDQKPCAPSALKSTYYTEASSLSL